MTEVAGAVSGFYFALKAGGWFRVEKSTRLGRSAQVIFGMLVEFALDHADS